MSPSQFMSLDPSERVKINVGGRMFETTVGTLQGAGEGSTLVKIASENHEPFFDRDPQPFEILLSLLRTGKIDDQCSKTFPLNKLIREATFYGLVEQLQTALAPDHLDGIKIEKQKNLTPNSPVPGWYPLAARSDGSVCVGDGKKITIYDWALRKGVTTVTELPIVQILDRISDTNVVTASTSSPGVHIYNVVEGTLAKSLRWQEGRNYPGVGAITSNDTQIFMRSTASSVTSSNPLVIDKTRMEILNQEIGEQNVKFSENRAEDCMRLQWLPEKNLLLEGISSEVRRSQRASNGYITLWDVRSGNNHVWQCKDDYLLGFADIVASEECAGIFIISRSNTGYDSIKMCDMRNLTATDRWLTISGSNSIFSRFPKLQTRLQTHNKQLYLSRGGTLQVWSEVRSAESFRALPEKKYTETSFRLSIVDECATHGGQLDISHLAVGGNRLFISRKSGVEVWESRCGM